MFDADFTESKIPVLEHRIRMRLEDFEHVYSRFRPDSLVSHIKMRSCSSSDDQYVATDISAIGRDRGTQKSASRKTCETMTGDANVHANRRGDDSIGSHVPDIDGGKRVCILNDSDHADGDGTGDGCHNHDDAHRDHGSRGSTLAAAAGESGGAHHNRRSHRDTRDDCYGQRDDAIHTIPSHHGLRQEEGHRPATAHEVHAHNANAQSIIFPEDAEGLFTLADMMYAASGGRIDPCVGADLEALGYDAELRFTIMDSRTDDTGHSPNNGMRQQSLSDEGSASRRSSSQTVNGTSHRASPPSSASAIPAPIPSATQSATSGPTAPTLPSSQASAISSSQAVAPTMDSRRPVPRNHPRNQSKGIASPASPALPTPRAWGGNLGAAHRPTWAQLRAGAGPCELRIPAGSPPPALDFGAYGKGYAVDLVADLLEAAGVRSYVIDASGDLRVRSFGSLPLTQDDTPQGDVPIQNGMEKETPAQNDKRRSTAAQDDNTPAQNDNKENASSPNDTTIRKSDKGRNPIQRRHGNAVQCDTNAPNTPNDTATSVQGNDEATAPIPANLPRQPREPLRIALESPFDASQAVGVAEISDGSFCASGVTRRHWHDDASGMELHHILDALNGRPTRGILASWTYVGPRSNVHPNANASSANTATTHTTSANTGVAAPSTSIDPTPDARADMQARIGTPGVASEQATTSGATLANRYPTAVADALATALFSSDPARLRDYLPYDFALVRADGTARGSAGFPGRLFTR